MTSGTFTFVTGLADGLDRALAAAGDRNVLGHVDGQLLRAGLVDELRLHLVPILLAAGTRLFDDPGQAGRRLELAGVTGAPGVTHLRYQLPR